MPNYKCERCLKEFDQKCNYTHHINKKFPCNENPQKPSKFPQIPSENGKSEITCNYCGKEFSRKDNLTRHIDGYCKVKKENDRKMDALMERLIKIEENNRRLEESDKKNAEKIARLEEENSNYKKIINNTQNIGTLNNIGTQNITFKINAYGTEDSSKITVNDYKRILGRGMNSVPAFVEKLHFDKNVPENHNVYISNLRDEYVLMYDGKIWRLKDRDDALQQLYDDKSDILETKFEELIERLDEPTIRMFKRFLKIKDDDDEKIKIIKKELKKTLYENRGVVMNTRKKDDSMFIKE